MHHFRYEGNEFTCEGVPVRALAAAYGTPLYLYSRATIAENCRRIEAAFDGAPHLSCYAVKANANPTLLRLIAGEGFGADVGSKGELYLALGAGFRPAMITFSGVGKRDDEITYALERGIHAFAVESMQEIEVIGGIARQMGTVGRILLRVNLDIDAGGHAYISTSTKLNKFGIPHQDARDVLLRAASIPGIDIRGIHSHIGSQITDPDVFRRGATAIGQLVTDLRQAGLPLHECDFGGGYGVQYHGAVRHPGIPAEAPEREGLSTEGLIRTALPILAATGCRLSIQPGRSVVAESGALIVTTLYRNTTGAKTFIITDGAMNDLIRPSLYHSHHQIVPALLTGAEPEPVDVVGPVCESGDFFAQDRQLPRVDRGAVLAILGAGAYGYVLSSNYNARLRPAEVLVDGTMHQCIRERETLEDLVRGELKGRFQ